MLEPEIIQGKREKLRTITGGTRRSIFESMASSTKTKFVDAKTSLGRTTYTLQAFRPSDYLPTPKETVIDGNIVDQLL